MYNENNKQRNVTKLKTKKIKNVYNKDTYIVSEEPILCLLVIC
jgi:hypothetical protein